MGEPNCLFTRATNVPFLLSTRLFFPGVYDLLMRPTLDLIYPFTGMWMAKNSPRDRVPSHGTSLFASEMAIDFLPVDEYRRTAPFQLRSLFTPERPEDFPGFGRLLRHLPPVKLSQLRTTSPTIRRTAAFHRLSTHSLRVSV